MIDRTRWIRIQVRPRSRAACAETKHRGGPRRERIGRQSEGARGSEESVYEIDKGRLSVNDHGVAKIAAFPSAQMEIPEPG